MKANITTTTHNNHLYIYIRINQINNNNEWITRLVSTFQPALEPKEEAQSAEVTGFPAYPTRRGIKKEKLSNELIRYTTSTTSTISTTATNKN